MTPVSLLALGLALLTALALADGFSQGDDGSLVAGGVVIGSPVKISGDQVAHQSFQFGSFGEEVSFGSGKSLTGGQSFGTRRLINTEKSRRNEKSSFGIGKSLGGGGGSSGKGEGALVGGIGQSVQIGGFSNAGRVDDTQQSFSSFSGDVGFNQNEDGSHGQVVQRFQAHSGKSDIDDGQLSNVGHDQQVKVSSERFLGFKSSLSRHGGRRVSQKSGGRKHQGSGFKQSSGRRSGGGSFVGFVGGLSRERFGDGENRGVFSRERSVGLGGTKNSGRGSRISGGESSRERNGGFGGARISGGGFKSGAFGSGRASIVQTGDRSSDGRFSGRISSSGRLSSGQSSGGKFSDGQSSGGRFSSGQSSGRHFTGRRSSGEKFSGKQSSGGRVSGGQSSGGRFSGGQSSGGRFSSGRSSDGRSSGVQFRRIAVSKGHSRGTNVRHSQGIGGKSFSDVQNTGPVRVIGEGNAQVEVIRSEPLKTVSFRRGFSGKRGGGVGFSKGFSGERIFGFGSQIRELPVSILSRVTGGSVGEGNDGVRRIVGSRRGNINELRDGRIGFRTSGRQGESFDGSFSGSNLDISGGGFSVGNIGAFSGNQHRGIVDRFSGGNGDGFSGNQFGSIRGRLSGGTGGGFSGGTGGGFSGNQVGGIGGEFSGGSGGGFSSNQGGGVRVGISSGSFSGSGSGFIGNSGGRDGEFGGSINSGSGGTGHDGSEVFRLRPVSEGRLRG